MGISTRHSVSDRLENYLWVLHQVINLRGSTGSYCVTQLCTRSMFQTSMGWYWNGLISSTVSWGGRFQGMGCRGQGIVAV